MVEMDISLTKLLIEVRPVYDRLDNVLASVRIFFCTSDKTRVFHIKGITIKNKHFPSGDTVAIDFPGFDSKYWGFLKFLVAEDLSFYNQIEEKVLETYARLVGNRKRLKELSAKIGNF